MKFMNIVKKFGSKVVETSKSTMGKALAFFGLVGATVGGTPANAATFEETLTALQTKVETAIASIFDTLSGIFSTQITLVLLFVAFGLLIYAIKKK